MGAHSFPLRLGVIAAVLLTARIASAQGMTTVAPTTINSGDTVTVTVKDCVEPGTTIVVYASVAGAPRMAIGTTVADQQGGFSQAFRIPSGISGAVTIQPNGCASAGLTVVPNGSFINPHTHAGMVTGYNGAGDFTVEVANPRGVELNYTLAPFTSACTQVATIQVLWLTDAHGKLQPVAGVPNAGDRNAAAADVDHSAGAGGGYTLDFAGGETTPYYEDSGGGALNNGVTGTSDGAGHSVPAAGASHVSDAPTAMPALTVHFEDWAVCIAGHNAGEVLAGVSWERDTHGHSRIVGPLNAPSKGFKDALHAWEDWHNAADPGHPYVEPSGGFVFR
jgi:hypothetical protein